MNAARKQSKYLTHSPKHRCTQQPDMRFKMALLLLLTMLTACAATPQDLSGKMFTFPEETNTVHVKLSPSRQDFSAASVCLRFFTGLSRNYSLFSVASESADNEFAIFVEAPTNFSILIQNKKTVFERHDIELNTWHSVCSTRDPDSGLVELWFDGQPSNSTFVSFGSINGPFNIVVGQDQDSFGGRFNIKESFVGNMSDVHMWDYELSPCEIRGYMNHKDFSPGNVLNWRALEFQINGTVLIQPNVYNLNLSGKMFTFPGETNTSHVKLIPSRQDFSAASVCLRFFTGLSRDYSLFSVASESGDDEFVIFVEASKKFSILIKNKSAVFERHDIELNKWHSVCFTWDPDFELWFDGKPCNSPLVSFGSIKGPVMITVGQDLQAHQSFVGNMSDVHMWDYELSPCEIDDYMNCRNFTSGNVSWSALEFKINENTKEQSKNDSSN